MKYANNFTKIFTFVVIFLLFGNSTMSMIVSHLISRAVSSTIFHPVLVSGTTIIILYLLAFFIILVLHYISRAHY